MSSLPWYVARAAGLCTYVLLTVSMLWGTALAACAFRHRPGLPWLNAMHEWLGVLTLVFLGVHLTGLLLDTYVAFSPLEVLVPFASHWRPGAVAWGVVAMYLLLAVHLSARLRRKLPKRYRHLWKRVHLASYLLFGLATIHLLRAGTDATSLPAMLLVSGALAAVLAAVGQFRWAALERTLALREPG